MSNGVGAVSVRLRVPPAWRKKPHQRPPLYTPHPDSLLPLRRCFRTDCRTLKPGHGHLDRCPRCNSLLDSTSPLVKWFLYVENF